MFIRFIILLQITTNLDKIGKKRTQGCVNERKLTQKRSSKFILAFCQGSLSNLRRGAQTQNSNLPEKEQRLEFCATKVPDICREGYQKESSWAENSTNWVRVILHLCANSKLCLCRESLHRHGTLFCRFVNPTENLGMAVLKYTIDLARRKGETLLNILAVKSKLQNGQGFVQRWSIPIL